MNIDNWNYGYKIFNGAAGPTNLLYTPMINPEKTIMCMDWENKRSYFPEIKKVDKEYSEIFFELEKKNLLFFQDKSWVPKIIDITQKKIFIEWNGNNCNNLIFENDIKLEDTLVDWKEQFYFIIKDILDSGYYKMSLYSHCFFFKDNKLKTFDFYSCVRKDNPLILREIVAGLITPSSSIRFSDATDDRFINFKIFFENTLKSSILNESWNNTFEYFTNTILNLESNR